VIVERQQCQNQDHVVGFGTPLLFVIDWHIAPVAIAIFCLMFHLLSPRLT